MRKLMILPVFILGLNTKICLAEDNSLDTDPLNNFHVSKGEVIKSLDEMKNMRKINEKEYSEAKRELASYDDKKMEDMNNKAKDLIRVNPDKAVEIYKDQNADTGKMHKMASELENQKPQI
jgi:hypothetical protein